MMAYSHRGRVALVSLLVCAAGCAMGTATFPRLATAIPGLASAASARASLDARLATLEATYAEHPSAAALRSIAAAYMALDDPMAAATLRTRLEDAAADPTLAQDDERGIAALKAGVALLQRGQHTRALRSFYTAYAFLHRPSVQGVRTAGPSSALFNIAEVQRQRQELATALSFYRRSLAEQPDPATVVDEAARRHLKIISGLARGNITTLEGSLVREQRDPNRRPLPRRPLFWVAMSGAAALVAITVGLGVGLSLRAGEPVTTLPIDVHPHPTQGL